MPLVLATGAGSASQRAIGTGVIGGMITATGAGGVLRAGVLRRRAPHVQGQRAPAPACTRTSSTSRPARRRAAARHEDVAPPRRRRGRRAGQRLRLAGAAVRTAGRAGCPTCPRRSPASRPSRASRRRTSPGRRSSPTRGCKRLIELALQNNRDLRVAVLDIEQARARCRRARADGCRRRRGRRGVAPAEPVDRRHDSTSYSVGFAFSSLRARLLRPRAQPRRRRAGAVPRHRRGAQGGADQPGRRGGRTRTWRCRPTTSCWR